MNQTFRIAPDGSDANAGGPWATLAGARDALRALRASSKLHGNAEVFVADGTYSLTETVEFGPEDGLTAYKAEAGSKPVFSGGRVLSGLTETTHAGRRAWTVDISEVAAGHWTFRSLFVDGQRRPRARLPKFSANAEGVGNTYRIGAIRFPERRDLFAGDNAFFPQEGDIQPWPGLAFAEIVLLHYWVETRLPSPRFEHSTGWVTCARRSVFNLYESFNPLLARYYIDNLFEALTDPGEWYLDRVTGKLTYLPFDHENLAETFLVAPVLNQFVEVKGEAFNHGARVGDPFGTRCVTGLSFEGLTFRHADWYPPIGHMLPHDSSCGVSEEIPLGSSPQAAAHIPAAIRFRWSRDCHFSGNAVELVGFTGLEFGPGCRNIVASHNSLLHLGGGGIKVEGSELDGPAGDRTGQIQLMDNTIGWIGRVFHQSVGILLTTAFDCDIAHNEIAHTCYTGISCGWSWGYRNTITQNIRIEGNLIHDICEGVLSDNGGIYLLGVQPGTVVRGNHIFRVTAADYGGWGIYPDEGSSHIVIEQNWIHDTGGAGLNVHYGREIIARDNVICRPGDAFMGVGRGEGHIGLDVHHNVLIGPAEALFSGAYAGDIRKSMRSDANLFWFSGEAPPKVTHPSFRTDVPHAITWEEWLEGGNDRNSQIADPLTRETLDSIVFEPSSPALSMGFRPYDWSRCGPRR